MDIKKYLYEKVKSIMSDWDEGDIYAVSFFVESNEANTYREYSNVTEFSISYNTEEDYDGAGELDEQRWNYAFWSQNEFPIISDGNEGMEILFDWYCKNGIKNIGEENGNNDYDAKHNYIGKGPVGHYELLTLASNIAKKLQNESFLKEKFKKIIPIIVHGLEYAWYDIEATKNANPHGEAKVFLKAMEINEFS
ncbi:MAG: hypothetical protein WC677_03485 [Clostridia bacterium]|jgi:hypothetical protein